MNGDAMPIALAYYTQAQIDALDHGEIADRLRRYPHPLLQAAADSLDYLHAQEGLLEVAQKAAERARAELAETKRPLDDQMARLNQRVIELTGELDALRLRLPPSPLPPEASAEARPTALPEDTDAMLIERFVSSNEQFYISTDPPDWLYCKDGDGNSTSLRGDWFAASLRKFINESTQ
jgi:hypothetical protein